MAVKIPKPRARIPGGITCHRCGHERFKFMPACPKCEDAVFRDLDTSTNELKLKVWAGAGMISLLTLGKLLGGVV